MRPVGTAQELARRRYRAVQLLEEGHGVTEVAQIVDVDRRSVRRWKSLSGRKGLEALEPRVIPGRPGRLNARQRERLKVVLLRGAKDAGFHSDLWTCPRVAEVIRVRFGISYHPDHIGRLLHAMGFTPQRPQRKAVERNEEAIQGWIHEQWPRIKKKPRA